MLNKKRVTLIGLSLIVASAGCLYAYGKSNDLFTTRGFYGGIQYIFLNDINDATNEDRKSYIQIYQMGYEGSIYSPRLLKYDISGALYFDKSHTKNNKGTEELNIEDQNFKLYLDFIKGSKYPFTLFVEKQALPVISLTNVNLYTARDIYRYGLYGSVDLKDYTFRYNLERRESKTTQISGKEDIKANNFIVSMERRFKNSGYSIYTRYSDADYYRTSLDNNITKVTSRLDRTKELKLSYRYSPGKRFRLNSYIRYVDDDYYDLKRTTVSLDAYWMVDRSYTINYGLLGQSLRDDDYESNYLTWYANGKYKLNSKLQTTQNIQFYNIYNDNLKQNIGSFSLGLNYNDYLNETVSYFVNTNVGLRVERGENDDENLTAGLNKNINLYSIGAGITKRFTDTGSILNFSTQYNYQSSDLGDELSRYSISGNFMKRIRNNLTYNLSGSYYNGKNVFYSVSKLAENDSEYLTVTNKFNYGVNMGINGKFLADVGLKYYRSQTSSGMQPYLNMTVFYRLQRNLVFNAKANITKDLYLNSTNYTTIMGVNYRIRKIRISAGARYVNQIREDLRQNGHKNIYLKFERVF